MKSAAHGTYLKALPSDNSYVEQTRDENELGTEPRKLTNPLSSSPGI